MICRKFNSTEQQKVKDITAFPKYSIDEVKFNMFDFSLAQLKFKLFQFHAPLTDIHPSSEWVSQTFYKHLYKFIENIFILHFKE